MLLHATDADIPPVLARRAGADGGSHTSPAGDGSRDENNPERRKPKETLKKLYRSEFTSHSDHTKEQLKTCAGREAWTSESSTSHGDTMITLTSNLTSSLVRSVSSPLGFLIFPFGSYTKQMSRLQSGCD
jgi:hypothetical protein